MIAKYFATYGQQSGGSSCLCDFTHISVSGRKPFFWSSVHESSCRCAVVVCIKRVKARFHPKKWRGLQRRPGAVSASVTPPWKGGETKPRVTTLTDTETHWSRGPPLSSSPLTILRAKGQQGLPVDVQGTQTARATTMNTKYPSTVTHEPPNIQNTASSPALPACQAPRLELQRQYLLYLLCSSMVLPREGCHPLLQMRTWRRQEVK